MYMFHVLRYYSYWIFHSNSNQILRLSGGCAFYNLLYHSYQGVCTIFEVKHILVQCTDHIVENIIFSNSWASKHIQNFARFIVCALKGARFGLFWDALKFTEKNVSKYLSCMLCCILTSNLVLSPFKFHVKDGSPISYRGILLYQ